MSAWDNVASLFAQGWQQRANERDSLMQRSLQAQQLQDERMFRQATLENQEAELKTRRNELQRAYESDRFRQDMERRTFEANVSDMRGRNALQAGRLVGYSDSSNSVLEEPVRPGTFDPVTGAMLTAPFFGEGYGVMDSQEAASLVANRKMASAQGAATALNAKMYADEQDRLQRYRTAVALSDRAMLSSAGSAVMLNAPIRNGVLGDLEEGKFYDPLDEQGLHAMGVPWRNIAGTRARLWAHNYNTANANLSLISTHAGRPRSIPNGPGEDPSIFNPQDLLLTGDAGAWNQYISTQFNSMGIPAGVDTNRLFGTTIGNVWRQQNAALAPYMPGLFTDPANAPAPQGGSRRVADYNAKYGSVNEMATNRPQ